MSRRQSLSAFGGSTRIYIPLAQARFWDVEELNHMMSYAKCVDPRVRIMEITISKTLEIAHGQHSIVVSIVNAGGKIL